MYQIEVIMYKKGENYVEKGANKQWYKKGDYKTPV